MRKTLILEILVFISLIGCSSQSPPVYMNSMLFPSPQEDTIFLLCGGVLVVGEEVTRSHPQLWEYREGNWRFLSDCKELPSMSNISTFNNIDASIFMMNASDSQTWRWSEDNWKIVCSIKAEMKSSCCALIFNSKKEQVEYYDFEKRVMWYLNKNSWIKGEELTKPVEGFDWINCGYAYDSNRGRFVFYGSYEGNVKLFEYENQEWREIPMGENEIFLGEGIVFDDKKQTFFFVCRHDNDHRLHIYECKEDGLVLVGAKNPPISRWGASYCYDRNLNGIFMHGGIQTGLIFNKHYKETWLAEYSESDSEFTWRRLD